MCGMQRHWFNCVQFTVVWQNVNVYIFLNYWHYEYLLIFCTTELIQRDSNPISFALICWPDDVKKTDSKTYETLKEKRESSIRRKQCFTNVYLQIQEVYMIIIRLHKSSKIELTVSSVKVNIINNDFWAILYSNKILLSLAFKILSNDWFTNAQVITDLSYVNYRFMYVCIWSCNFLQFFMNMTICLSSLWNILYL